MAEFLALVQILIYGGAITIVLLFALMLTRAEEFSNVRDNPQWAVAAVAALSIFGVLGGVILNNKLDTQELAGPSLEELGTELFTNWVVPFEIASLLLLVALIGTVYLAKKRVSMGGLWARKGSGAGSFMIHLPLSNFVVSV